jgi:hypothetical protein
LAAEKLRKAIQLAIRTWIADGSNVTKAIGFGCQSKVCNVCSAYEKVVARTGILGAVAAHHCSRNRDGSSGAMEADSLLETVTDLHHYQHVAIGKLCCDD